MSVQPKAVARTKGIKSSLKSIYTIFILAIVLLTAYFLIDSRVRAIIQQGQETQRVNTLIKGILTHIIVENGEEWSAALDSIAEGKEHPAAKDFHNLLVLAEQSDSGIYEAYVCRVIDSTSYKLLSSAHPIGEVVPYDLSTGPRFRFTNDTTEVAPSFQFGSSKNSDDGSGVSTSSDAEAIPLQQTIYDKEGNPICVLLVAINTRTFLATLKENMVGNLLTVFILVGLTLIITGFMFRRIIRKEESIKGELSQVNLLLEEKNTEIIDSINYAKRIQDAYLPEPQVLQHFFPESFILFKPKDVVSGDFYWFYSMLNTSGDNDPEVFLAVADCTGHGVPGAIMSVICCNALNEATVNRGITDPGKVLDFARDQVITNLKSRTNADTKDGMDIALCKVNRTTLEVEFAGANNPVWVIADNAMEGCDTNIQIEGSEKVLSEFRANKQPIGMYAAMKPFVTRKFKLQKGDSVYLSSDGFPDQFGGERGKKLKSINLKKKLLRMSDSPMEVQVGMLHKEFDEWKGELEQIDDVCVMGVQV